MAQFVVSTKELISPYSRLTPHLGKLSPIFPRKFVGSRLYLEQHWGQTARFVQQGAGKFRIGENVNGQDQSNSHLGEKGS